MFSSLDRIDIVFAPKGDDRPHYLQTDHRTAEEIAQEPALSVLFAMVRVLNPKRMAQAGSPKPVVLYSAQQPPPAFLREAIRVAGGQLVLGASLEPEPEEGEAPSLEEILGAAFADLARAVAVEHGVELSLDGLAMVERALAETAGDPEEDEFAYWSAVMKLGSFGGELIRASNGGRWQVVPSGSLPFALSTGFRGEQATVNPLGKAIKRFANGEEDSLGPLVSYLRSQP